MSIATAGLAVSSAAQAAPTEPLTLTNELVSSVDCAYCHRFNNDPEHLDQPPFAAYVGWQGSMMANAARDPVFWAGVALAAVDHPEETVDCIRCHSPRAFIEGRGDAISVDELTLGDLEGVTCEACHRMVDDGSIGNARYTIDDMLVDGDVPRRGPWDYTDGVPLPDEHQTLADPFTGSSEMCGVCHDVTTERERVDDAGVSMMRPFNEQRTYSEWAGSAFAQPGDGFRSCQDCHMTEVPDTSACNSYVEVHDHRSGNRRHDFLGANRFMLEIFRVNYSDQVPIAIFNNALDRMDEFIQSSATLEVDVPAAVRLGEGMSDLTVTVTNETGHKLPSGYSEGRVMWIEVTATYGDAVVFSSGQWDQRSGTFEQDANLRTYRGVAENYADGTRFHIVLNNHWVEDTRIPPRGMVQDLEIDPVTDRYVPLDDGTWPHWDTHNYQFEGRPDVEDATPGDATDDELEVHIRLLYLINSAEYIQVLAEDNTLNEAGNEVASMFEVEGGATPLVLAEQTVAVPIEGFGEVASTGTSSTTSTPDPDSSGGSAGPMTSPGTSAGSSSTGGTDSGGGASDGGGGCSCRAASGAGAGLGWSLMLLLMPLWGRRRRPGESPPRAAVLRSGSASPSR